ncbi:replication initiation protein [Escherichia coli]|uniref:replication initiation protein n=1 Tax=Escherichia coli TaxID=562 RepID=UPI00388DA60D
MQTYFTASVSEDDDEMAVLGDSTFKVKVADYQQIFQVSRNQAIKDVKEGVFELSRSAVIFYPKEGRFDCVARPWLTEAGSRSARGIWEIEFNHKLLRYIYGLTNQFTTYFAPRLWQSSKSPDDPPFMKVLLNSNLQAYGLLLMLG